MSKKTPSSRADCRLSNLVLEGGKSKVYRDAKTGHFIPVKEAQRRPNTTVETVVKGSPHPPKGKGTNR